MRIKQITTAVIASALLVFALCSCADAGSFSDSETLSKGYERAADTEKTYNYADGAEEPPAAYNSYANLITGYELKLFRRLSADKQSSTFAFSPAVNALDLSLLANGAKGDTLSEISLALGSDLSLDQLNTCSSYFKSRLEAVSKQEKAKTDELSGKTISDETSASTELYGAFLFNDKSDIRTAFLQCNADYYSDDIFRFGFSGENAQTKLENQLKDIPYSGTIGLDDDDSLLTVSSAQITDLWLTPYGSEDISLGKFGDSDVQYMRSEESYIHTDTAKGIIKYTAENPLKLVLIMPNENIGIENYIKTFDNSEYMNLLQSFGVTSRVSAVVPGIEIKAEDEPAAMSGVMKDAGLYTLFTDKADFGNLTHSDSIVLNEMYELRTGFSLNKNGVSTSPSEQPDSALTQTPTAQATDKTEKTDELRFDRPFIFMLIDNESSIPVYMGTFQ